MHVSVATDIRAPPEAVWAILSDLENAPDVIDAIDAIEVLEPAAGPSLVGLRWRETRTLFGKEATEEMWVTDAEDGAYYETRAESHGSVYVSRLSIEPVQAGTRLTMTLDAQPQTLVAKLLGGVMGLFFKGSVRKALQMDLADIKRAAEGAD